MEWHPYIEGQRVLIRVSGSQPSGLFESRIAALVDNRTCQTWGELDDMTCAGTHLLRIVQHTRAEIH
eukprot:scaffold40879_cov32-Prasinocladus_malaysianus.AAC.1